MALLPHILAALCMSIAWLTPGSTACAVLGWLSVFAYCISLRDTRHPYLHSYIGGVLLYSIGFYWLFETIQLFGGFNSIESALIFGLFVALSAVQIPLFVFIYQRSKDSLSGWHFAPAIAWGISEYFSIKIFPWVAGHTQLAFTPFAQVADLGGAYLISFIMFYCAESVLSIFSNSTRSPRSFLALFIFILSLWHGSYQMDSYSYSDFREQKVGLVQANVSIQDKHNVKYFEINTKRYEELTAKIASDGLLVVWPEAVIQEFISSSVGMTQNDPRLPSLNGKKISLLLGSLTFDTREKYYNSALAIEPDGTVLPPYHKMILMPFGEYTPLAGFFPWLKDIHETPDFTPGQSVKIFEYPASDGKGMIKLSPLICYEDVLPSLSRQAVLQGAQFLVNLTNDAWFGDTVAPLQHNLIASFRAIENKRYLLRSTNTGLSAIINPLGVTERTLPVFSEGSLVHKIKLLSESTVYSSLVGEKFAWGLLMIFVLANLISKLIGFGRTRS